MQGLQWVFRCDLSLEMLGAHVDEDHVGREGQAHRPHVFCEKELDNDTNGQLTPQQDPRLTRPDGSDDHGPETIAIHSGMQASL